MTTTFGLRRRAVSYLTAGGLAIAGGLVLANAGAAQAQVMHNGDKVWVCKYVGKPGVDERLKAGKNPIEVGWPSADKDKDGNVSVGDEFADAQGRSVVVQINGSDPGIAACPPVTPPTTPPPTTPPTTHTTPPTTPPPTTPPTTHTTPPTTPPTTTTTTTSVPPTTKTSTTSTTPATTPATSGGGGGVTPGTGAPNTGGAGDVNPANGLVGSGLLLAAAGVLANETLRRRRSVEA